MATDTKSGRTAGVSHRAARNWSVASICLPLLALLLAWAAWAPGNRFELEVSWPPLP